MAIETGDTVEIEYTGRLKDGTIFDTSRESVANEAGLIEAQPEREFTPLTVEIGSGRLIEGLEEGLLGREVGDTPTITIPPEQGYGEWAEKHVEEYDPGEFSTMIGGQTPEEGAYIETQDGERAEIIHVDDDVVRIDFNHELAGETVEFDVEIIDVR